MDSTPQDSQDSTRMKHFLVTRWSRSLNFPFAHEGLHSGWGAVRFVGSDKPGLSRMCQKNGWTWKNFEAKTPFLMTKISCNHLREPQHTPKGAYHRLREKKHWNEVRMRNCWWFRSGVSLKILRNRVTTNDQSIGFAPKKDLFLFSFARSFF